MKKRITILGSTGSIGTTTLKIIDYKKQLFEVDTLIANSNYKKILSSGASYIACSSFVWNNKKLNPVIK